MKRIGLVILLWAVMVGGFGQYMARRVPAAQAGPAALARSEAVYRLEVTPTFAAEADPFALQTGNGEEDVVLRVLLNGVEVLRRGQGIPAGQPVSVDRAPGVLAGANEFYLEASPPVSAGGQAHAVRVRLFRDGIPVADHTLWSEAGGRIAGAFTLEAPEAGGEERHAD